ncbi:MAG TPA: hypothetical protein VMQ81_02085, partial [Acidimicrobiia bacterium]|nr:hypothetical protein [Acidimicrobiia bacterium]
MSARRTIAPSALVAATVAAAIATAAALGPRVLTAVGQLRATDRDPAAIASVVSLEPRWVEPVTGWPSAIAADGRGAVVLAGRGEVRALDRDGSTRWRVEVPAVALHPPALA